MSANDKAAATYGRYEITVAGKLALHEWDYDAKNDACCCKCNGWTGPGPTGDEENDTWERHAAEMLEPLIVAREQEAARQALTNAADQLEPGTPGNTYLYELADEIDLDMGAGYTGGDDQTATNAAAAWIRSRAEQ